MVARPRRKRWHAMARRPNRLRFARAAVLGASLVATAGLVGGKIFVQSFARCSQRSLIAVSPPVVAERSSHPGMRRLILSTFTLGGILPAHAEGSELLQPTGQLQCLTRMKPDASNCLLSAAAPAGWRRDPLASPMRMAQWNLDPGYYEDANVVIFFLPLGAGVDEQLIRWENEFPQEARTAQPRRSGAFDVVTGGAVTLEVSGAWTRGRRATTTEQDDAPLLEGYALRGAIVPAVPAAKGEMQFAYFVKAIGPEAFMKRDSGDLAAFVASMKRG